MLSRVLTSQQAVHELSHVHACSLYCVGGKVTFSSCCPEPQLADYGHAPIVIPQIMQDDESMFAALVVIGVSGGLGEWAYHHQHVPSVMLVDFTTRLSPGLKLYASDADLFLAENLPFAVAEKILDDNREKLEAVVRYARALSQVEIDKFRSALLEGEVHFDAPQAAA